MTLAEARFATVSVASANSSRNPILATNSFLIFPLDGNALEVVQRQFRNLSDGFLHKDLFGPHWALDDGRVWKAPDHLDDEIRKTQCQFATLTTFGFESAYLFGQLAPAQKERSRTS